MLRRASSSTLLLLAALATAAALSFTPSFAATSDSRSLYAQAVAADDHVSYSGTLTSVVYEGDHALSTVARIEHQQPSAWRIWYLAPADAYGRMIVSNEKLTYQYEPSSNRVISHDWSEAAPGVAEPVDVAQINQNYAIETGPSSSVAGRKATSISLVSKHTGTLVQRIWADNQTKLILRTENYNAEGAVASKSSFDSISVGVNLPPGLFSLTVPSGMTLVAGTTYEKATTDTAALVKTVDFKFADPKYLPDGFVLKNGSLSSQNGVRTIEFVYSDGLRMFSLFENATARMPRFDRATPRPIQIGDASGETADIAGQTLASWNAGGLNLTIVGDLPQKEIAKIGASIHP